MAIAAYRGPDLSCPLCYEEYETPMLLICKHRICNSCVQHLQKGGYIKCPDCKTSMHISDIKSDKDMEDALGTHRDVMDKAGGLFKKAKNILCTVCKSTGFQWKCDACGDKLCDECKSNHDKRIGISSSGAEHKIEPAEALSFAEAEVLRHRAQECTEIIEACSAEQAKLTLTVAEMEREKTAILEFLRRTQQQIVDMVNSYFASLDEAYLDATPEEMDIINEKLASLRSDPRDPISGLKALKEYTHSLWSNSDDTGLEYFQKIKELHLEQIERFREFYGTPFKLPGRVGDETRRYSNLQRSKVVLEAISGYDSSGRLADATSVEECLPTVDEIVQITGISRDDVIDVLNMYNITLRDSESKTGQESTTATDSGAAKEADDSVSAPKQEQADAILERIPHESEKDATTSAGGENIASDKTSNQDSLFGDLNDSSNDDNCNSSRSLQTGIEHLNLGEIAD